MRAGISALINDRADVIIACVNSRAAMQLLEEVKQGMTQWSAVYDMTSGEIQVALGGDYGTVYSFQLGLVER